MIRAVLVGVIAFIAGVAVAVWVGDYLGVIDPIKSDAERALADRIEAIDQVAICAAVKTGAPIAREDHASLWHDDKSYLIGGWTVPPSGIPIFYWRGAGLPEDCA
jgi:hypothetical protein